jgi:hypothetical protein
MFFYCFIILTIAGSTLNKRKNFRIICFFITILLLILAESKKEQYLSLQSQVFFIVDFIRVRNLRQFFGFLPRVYTSFTRGIAVVARFPYLLNKSAICWCNCNLPGVLARTWGRNISWLEIV